MLKYYIKITLYVFLIHFLSNFISSASIGNVLKGIDTSDEDISYDQRQNGTENFRILIKDLVLVVPSEILSSNSEDSSPLGSISEIQHIKPLTSLNLLELGLNQVSY